MLEVDRHRAGMTAGNDPRLDAAAYARAAAEWRDRRLGATGPIEHRGELRLVARIGDDVRRIGVIAGKAAHVVRIRFSVGMRRAIVDVGRAERRERCRRREPERRKCDVPERRRCRAFRRLHAEALRDAGPREGLFLPRRALALATPPEMLEPRPAHVSLATSINTTAAFRARARR